MMKSFSAGTEVTAFHPNTLVPFKNLGLSITTDDIDTNNPKYHIKFKLNNQSGSTIGFSKLIQDGANPSTEFCAVMTCSSAEKACPFVFGADLSIPLTFEDPKRSDGTMEQDFIYTKTSHNIALHLATVFHIMMQQLSD
jgi:arsenate reductase